MSDKTSRAILTILLLLMVGAGSAAVYNCTSCEECTEKISSAQVGDTVYLTVDISEESEKCIEFNNITSITFDCQGNKIGGHPDNLSMGFYLNFSSNNIITKCNVYNFNFSMGLLDSNNNTIINNTIYWSDYGVFLSFSDYNPIIQNTIYSNFCGVAHNYADDNTLVQNTIKYNDYGILISSSYGNNIYHNNWLYNEENFYGELLSNSLDNGSEGNYWSDYSGVDLDGNGIGDVPYSIEFYGYEWDIDYYPLMAPYGGCPLEGDFNCDDIVTDFELLDYIDLWAADEVTEFDLLDAIDNWAMV